MGCILSITGIRLLISPTLLAAIYCFNRVNGIIELENAPAGYDIAESPTFETIYYVRRLNMDPKTVEVKQPTNNKSMILPGDVLFEVRMDFLPLCNYLQPEKHPELPQIGIKRLAYHFPTCIENQLGNVLGEHYGRLAVASAARIPYTMTCGEGEGSYKTHHRIVSYGSSTPKLSVLALLEVDMTDPLTPIRDVSGKPYSIEDVCPGLYAPSWYNPIGIDLVSDVIRQDMWKIAEADEHENDSFEPDDAVIHLRLGDALRSYSGLHERDGLIPHQAYSNLIEQASLRMGPIQTISIVTMPFDVDAVRPGDIPVIERSKKIAHDLVNHLQEKFPAASVTIHNHREETSSRAYSRLIRAKKVSICGPATFCTFPVLANRDGIGYILNGKGYTLNPWASRAALKYENIEVFGAPTLGNKYIEDLSDHDLFVWLQHQNPNIGYISIRDSPLIRYVK